MTILFRLIAGGKHSKQWFTRTGKLKHINKLKPWSLESVLVDKYGWSQEEATSFSSFLIPMLDFDQNNRAKADQCLKHPFLEGV